MAALAGFGAGMEVKAPKAPPALFPKFVVEEPGDFPALKATPPNKELIRLQRTMRAICKNSPYHTKPASQDRDVARYSDALKRDEEEVLGQLLHTRSRYLPRELRAPPLAVDPLAFDGDGFMDIETLLSGVGEVPPLPSFHPIPYMPAELTSHLDSAVPPSPAKRKRPDGDDDIGNEPKQQTKKKAKKDDKTTKKKSAGKDAGGEEGKTLLDFSNLIKHKIVELRNYCRENGINVSSRNKQGYVDAIVAWQKKQPKPSATLATKTETVRTPAPSDKAAAVAAVAQDKGKEKVGDVPPKAGEVEANGGKLPRPLDRMARLAMLEEEGLEEGEEGNNERNKSRLLDEDDEEDENDYNERHDSDAEDDDDDDDDDNEPTF